MKKRLLRLDKERLTADSQTSYRGGGPPTVLYLTLSFITDACTTIITTGGDPPPPPPPQLTQQAGCSIEICP